MKMTLLALPVLIVVASAGCGDDGDTSTTDAMTTASTSDQPGTTSDDPETSSTGAGSGSGDTTEGPGGTTGSTEEVCLTCDPATEYCFESITDSPSEFSCRPVPKECAATVDCECIVPLTCEKTLQACEEGPPVLVECVEG